MNIKIVGVTVVTGSLEEYDQILIATDLPSPVPEIYYGLVMQIPAPKGTGIKYCKSVLETEPKVIDSEQEWGESLRQHSEKGMMVK